jgi:hypothetical protein
LPNAHDDPVGRAHIVFLVALDAVGTPFSVTPRVQACEEMIKQVIEETPKN